MVSTYRFELGVPVEQVGMATGATIHTANGLPIKMKLRSPSDGSSSNVDSKEKAAVI